MNGARDAEIAVRGPVTSAHVDFVGAPEAARARLLGEATAGGAPQDALWAAGSALAGALDLGQGTNRRTRGRIAAR